MACESHLNKGVEIATLPSTQPPGRGARRACCGAATSATWLSPAVDTSCGLALCKQKTYLPQATSAAMCLLEDDCLVTLTNASLGLKVSILPTTRPQTPATISPGAELKNSDSPHVAGNPSAAPRPAQAALLTEGFLPCVVFTP